MHYDQNITPTWWIFELAYLKAFKFTEIHKKSQPFNAFKPDSAAKYIFIISYNFRVNTSS